MSNYGPSLEERMAPSVERMRSLADIISRSVRVALPAIVQSFDPGPPATVKVLIAMDEFVLQNTAGTTAISLETKSTQLPVMQDVPILIPTGGGWSFTLPIKAGDECDVLFQDAIIDVWFEHGGLNNKPISQRRHHLSDGIAVFGLRSTLRSIANWSTTSAQLRNDEQTVVIDLAPAQITITAPALTVNCSGTAAVNAGTVAIDASTTATITAPEIDLIGIVNVTGSVKVNTVPLDVP